MTAIFNTLLLTLALLPSCLWAKGKTLKIGALVPEGTSWATNLKRMADEIEKETNGDVRFKLYLGGVAGDEPVVLRKIRSGQLHGGIFTGKALGEIYGDIRLLEVPFNFVNDRSKALSALEKMKPHFDQGLNKNGFQSLGYFELGKVYIVSKKPAKSIDGLKGAKIWAWEGDELVTAIMNNLKLVSVPLALPDVLTSLSTGMIESAYATPLAIIALQWQSKVNYLIDFPVTYSFGGLLLSQKAWQKIDRKHHKKVLSIAQKWTAKTNESTIRENQTSLATLKKMNIQFLTFPSSDMAKGQKIRQEVFCELRGKLFSEAGFQLFLQATSSKFSCKAT